MGTKTWLQKKLEVEPLPPKPGGEGLGARSSGGKYSLNSGILQGKCGALGCQGLFSMPFGVGTTFIISIAFLF